MKWANKGNELDEIASKIVDETHRYYIWGAGVFGISVLEKLMNEVQIIGFIDSDMNKVCKKINGYKVFSPDVLEGKRKEVSIIVATGWISEVYKELEKVGFQHNCNFFHANDFISIYMLHKRNEIHTISTNLPVTLKCTLRCKKCMGFIPYAVNPNNIEIEEIKKSLELYFNWVDNLLVLGIGGGDALIHPKIKEILEYIGETYYRTKVQEIEIYTNAIILPDVQLLEVFKKYNIIVRFSDYSQTIPERQHIQEMVSLLKSNNIRFDHVKWKNWYDIGYPQSTKFILEEEKLIEHYEKCITKLCTVIVKDKLYFCSVHASAVLAGLEEEDSRDVFNLKSLMENKRKEFLEFNLGFNTRGYVELCKKCNGYQNINRELIPVAEQIVGELSIDKEI